MTRRTYTYNGFTSTLTSPITDSSTSIALASSTGLQAPCYLVIEPDSLTMREYIKVASISAPTLENCTRGLAGSIASAQAHDSGVEVRAVMMHQIIDDLFLDIGELETGATAHYGGFATTDHPEVTGSSRGFMTAADKTKLDGVEAGAEANPSASELLTSIKTVDGPGSLLDADTVDGYHAADFADDNHTHSFEQNVEVDHWDDDTGGVLDVGFALALSGTFTKPSEWDAYKVLVTGNITVKNTGDTFGTTISTYVDRSGGTAGRTLSAGAVGPGGYLALNPVHEVEGLTGNSTFRIMAGSDGSSSAQVQASSLTLVAVRTLPPS